jgi:phosphopantetheinyl transferase
MRIYQNHLIFQGNTSYVFSIDLDKNQSEVLAERRQHEKAAFNLLLHNVLGPFVRILKTASGRPYLLGSEWQISISHSQKRLVMQLTKDLSPGIDTELCRSKLKSIRQRFVSGDEEALIEQLQCNELQALCMIWAAKEAVYKSADTKGISFKENLIVYQIQFENNNEGIINARLNYKALAKEYKLRFLFPYENEVIVFVTEII